MSDEPTLNDIDRLMSLEPPLLAVDVDTVIIWHRQQRARRVAGEKIEKQKVDLSTVLKLPMKSVVKVERRI